jgi:hypothetical protein
MKQILVRARRDSMPTVEEMLGANLLTTRFPSQRIDFRITTSVLAKPGQVFARAVNRVLSRLDTKLDGRVRYDVMARVLEGQPLNARFLIEQRIGGSPWPMTWIRDPSSGRSRMYSFQPWQPLVLTALRWMDQILPPAGTYTATENTTNPAPSDPLWKLPEPCWVVDMTLDPGFWNPEPRSARVWLAQDLGRCLDHRIEQRLSDGSVRVLGTSDWRQPQAGGPWIAGTRSVQDPALGLSSSMVVEHLDFAPLPDSQFVAEVMADQSW